MLISTNKSDKSNSKYQCDRCKSIISLYDRKSISVAEGYANPRKKWDLCPRCYRMLCKGIEKKEGNK